MNLFIKGDTMKRRSHNNDTFFTILKSAMNVPGVKIKRREYLEKELIKYFPENIVNIAIEKNPASAGISIDQIEKIAKSSIKYETNKVTTISTIAGIPGGFSMIGTIPGDIIQYFTHIIRILQKLIYLYGWKELYNVNYEFDDETMNQLTLFIGVMFGVQSANSAITKLSSIMAQNIQKSLVNRALTKGTIYPIVKKIARILSIKMTKEIFAKGVSKVVPLIGGAVSGAITYATFKPSANKLKKHLETLPTSDPKFYEESAIDKSNI